jgi:hypothetical protein
MALLQPAACCMGCCDITKLALHGKCLICSPYLSTGKQGSFLCSLSCSCSSHSCPGQAARNRRAGLLAAFRAGDKPKSARLLKF